MFIKKKKKKKKGGGNILKKEKRKQHRVLSTITCGIWVKSHTV